MWYKAKHHKLRFDVKLGLEDYSSMRLQEKYNMQVLMTRATTALGAFFVLGAMVLFISCSNSPQRYSQPAPGTPSSWENDVGRPADDGQKVFSRGWRLF